jgi:hypothetical protein
VKVAFAALAALGLGAGCSAVFGFERGALREETADGAVLDSGGLLDSGIYGMACDGTFLEISPPGLDFGEVKPNDKPVLDVKVTNRGAPATVTPRIDTSVPFSVVGPQRIETGATVTFAVTFAPTQDGRSSANMRFDVDGTLCNALPSITLAGAGSSAAVRIYPGSVAFGNVNCAAGAAKAVSIDNGSGAAQTFSASITAGGSFFRVLPTSGTISPGQIQSVTVNTSQFVSGVTPWSGTLTISVDSRTVAIPIQLQPYGAHYAFSPTALDFGGVTVATPKTVSITSDGNAPGTSSARLVVLDDFGRTSAVFQTEGTLQLSAGQTQSTTITFSTSTGGEYNETLSAGSLSPVPNCGSNTVALQATRN